MKTNEILKLIGDKALLDKIYQFSYHAERRFAVNHMTQYLRRANPKSDRTAAARPD
jgi:hypothetical protein